MRITQVKILQLVDKDDLVAYASFTIDDCFSVRDLKIFRRPIGYYITMPQLRDRGGKLREVAYPINAKTRKMIEEAVIEEYEKVAGKRAR
jgi:stage V sporulation protein G